jgi:hypothetical protein
MNNLCNGPDGRDVTFVGGFLPEAGERFEHNHLFFPSHGWPLVTHFNFYIILFLFIKVFFRHKSVKEAQLHPYYAATHNFSSKHSDFQKFMRQIIKPFYFSKDKLRHIFSVFNLKD